MITLADITAAFNNATPEEKKEFHVLAIEALKAEKESLKAKNELLLEEQRKTYQGMHDFFTGALFMKLQRMYEFNKRGW